MKKDKKENIYIYGKNALAEALATRPKSITKIFLDSKLHDSQLAQDIKKSGLSFSILKTPPRPVADAKAHQGVIAKIDLDKLLVDYKDFFNKLNITPQTGLVVLGEVQDPHNVGAIIRSAAAFGISAILLPEHNQAPVTGTVIKTSAGMAFRLPIVKIGNVNQTLRDLKDRGFWIYGLAGDGNSNLNTETFDQPTVFVLGNESDGIRAKTLETVDIKLSIPIDPNCESLNVSNAAAITLYAWNLQTKQT